jgi:hypothetical protein
MQLGTMAWSKQKPTDTNEFSFAFFRLAITRLMPSASFLFSAFAYSFDRCSALNPREAPTRRTPNSPISGSGLPVFGSCVGAGSGARAGAGAGRVAAATGTGAGASINKTGVGGGVAGLARGTGAGAVPVTVRVTLLSLTVPEVTAVADMGIPGFRSKAVFFRPSTMNV